MSALGDVFKSGGQAEQLLLWGVLQQLLQPLLAPLTTELSKLMYSATPDVPLSPADAAGLVARGLIDDGTGQDIANDNGIGQTDFHKLVDAARSAPDLGTLVAAFQRQLIHQGADDPRQLSLFGGLTDSGLRPEWFPIIEKLAVQIPSTAEVMNAWLEGQIERPEALRRYLEAGGDPTWFQTSYNANGEAPTPIQLLELVNRGIIPWNGTGPGVVSYAQGFLEGPWRNKWEPSFRALAEHVTPPRSVTAMYHAHQLTRDEAAAELKKSGLSPAMITAYLAPAIHDATTSEKHLAKGDVLSLYTDKLLTHTQAHAALVALKYSATDADHLLDLTDLKDVTAQLRAGVTRVRSLYQGGKLTASEAADALHALGVAAPQAHDLIDTWNVTQAHRVHELSAAQIESAMHYDLITEAEAMARLIALGFDQADAWLALSVRNHAPLKTIPRPADLGPAPVNGK